MPRVEGVTREGRQKARHLKGRRLDAREVVSFLGVSAKAQEACLADLPGEFAAELREEEAEARRPDAAAVRGVEVRTHEAHQTAEAGDVGDVD